MEKENNQLSDREKEILILVAEGDSNKEIARKLFISTNTVKVHLRNIFAKIGVSSRTEAAMYAVNEGIVSTTNQNSGVLDLKKLPSQSLDWKLVGAILFPLIILFFVVILSLIDNNQSFINDSDQIDSEAIVESRWQELAPMLTPRYSFAATIYDNKIYAIGGISSEGVTSVNERYDPELNEWISLAEKPTPVSEVSAVILGGNIYIPGGQLEDGEVTNILEVYNIHDDSWRIGRNLPTGVSAYSIETFEGSIYLFGGRNEESYFGTVYKYDPKENIWDEMSPMPTERAYAGSAVIENKISILGGISTSGLVDAHEVYSPNSEGGIDSPWSVGKPLPQRRYKFGISEVAGFIYVIGGIGENKTNLPSQVFMPQTGEWYPVEIFDSISWSDGGTITLGDNILVTGGIVENEPSSANLSYQAVFSVAIPIVR